MRIYNFTFWLVFTVPIGLLYSQNSTVYPLHIGDIWYYTDAIFGTQIVREVIKDTIMPDGHTYAQISWNSIAYSEYQRQSGDSVFVYNPQFNLSYLLYDFSRSPGDTITIQPLGNDTTIITLIWYIPIILFGQERYEWDFLVDPTPIPDDDANYHITDSIGVHRMHGWGYDYQLTGAIIDGVIYGNVTGIADESGGKVSEYELLQNYPNPFNPETAISYYLPVSSEVKLEIFNVLGQKIKTLVDQRQPAGHYTVRWDGTADNGEMAPAGMYFYRLTAGDYIAVKKMLLLP